MSRVQASQEIATHGQSDHTDQCVAVEECHAVQIFQYVSVVFKNHVHDCETVISIGVWSFTLGKISPCSV